MARKGGNTWLSKNHIQGNDNGGVRNPSRKYSEKERMMI